MQKNLVYILLGIVVALITLNLFLLFKPMKKKHHPPRFRPEQQVVQKLKFNEGQANRFFVEFKSHRNQIDDRQQEIGSLKKSIFQNIVAEQPETVDSLTKEVGLKVQEIEMLFCGALL